MAGYAASARIERVQPRLAQHDGPIHVTDDHAIDDPGPEAIDLTRPTWERWERFRESWAQTTFYLFDPESWR
jgi:hypothetical protein